MDGGILRQGFEAGGEKVFGSPALEVYFRIDMGFFHTYTHIYVLCETFRKNFKSMLELMEDGWNNGGMACDEVRILKV